MYAFIHGKKSLFYAGITKSPRTTSNLYRWPDELPERAAFHPVGARAVVLVGEGQTADEAGNADGAATRRGHQGIVSISVDKVLFPS